MLVKWHKHHHIKDSSIWQKPTNPWTWNALLDLKHLAERFISHTVRNGVCTKFWLDSWTPYCNLLKFIGVGGPRQLRVSIHASVADVCSNGQWRLPSPRSDNALSLHVYLTTIPLPNLLADNDSVDWILNGARYPAFSAAKA